MRGDFARLTRPIFRFALIAWCAIWVSHDVQGQGIPLSEVNTDTEVRQIRFRFTETQTFEPTVLQEHIWHTSPGAFSGLRRTFSFIPIIPGIGEHAFSPVELARDAVRLERFYQRNGFLSPEVDWLARLDSKNRLSILFVIQEGPPLLLDSLNYLAPDGRYVSYHLEPELVEDWARFRDRAQVRAQQRLDDFHLLQLEDQVLLWVKDRGYAFATVSSQTRVDSLANRASVTIEVDLGPQARIDEIQVEGNETVRDRVVRRELPFRRGDLFSQSQLTEGQREVFNLNIFTIALAEVPDQPVDSLVTVRLRVRERTPRTVSAQVGYLSEGGATGQVEWMHRNFLGDARTFTASAITNTGFAAFAENPDRRYRAGLSLRQPYVFDRRLSATGSVFAELRDDFRDRSRGFGGDVTFLWERGQFRTISAGYSFEDRRVQEFRFGSRGDTTQISLIEQDLNLADSLTTNLSRSIFGLGATYGHLDDAFSPRRGFLIRPSAQISLPFPSGVLQYGRVELTTAGFLPVSRRLTLATSVTGGYIHPYEGRPTSTGEVFISLLRMRDVVFLGGGAQDIRGWGAGVLGPKVLDLIIDTTEEDLTLYARRYYPIGGLARANATAEIRYDFNDRFGAFTFADVGRIWSPQADYQLETDSPLFDSAYGNVDRFFVGTGGGISIASPVGAIRLALGYKVNPSFFDVRSPQQIAEAWQDVFRTNPNVTNEDLRQAAMDVEPSFWRRLALHLSIGQTF